MAYTDDYVKTNWVNYPSTNTPINQTNLNHAEGGIKTNCGRIANLDTTKANQSDLLLTVKNVSFDSTTGTFTFTLWNNTTITVNTDIEKVAVNFTYDDDPASPHYQNLVLELSDGTYKYIDMSALITQYEFTNSSTIAFTVGVGGEITANVVDGSITANKLQPNYLADCQAAQTGAQNAKTAADADALKAEGFANGTQNGTPVTSGSPYYENNAKWWKEQAQAIASQSLAGLTDVDINAPADGDILVYDSGDNEWKNQGNHAVTVTNNPISIITQSAQVARDTKITLNPIQAAGTPTPSNPLPISGYDGVDLAVSKKNLIPSALGLYEVNPSASRVGLKPITLPSGTYTISFGSSNVLFMVSNLTTGTTDWVVPAGDDVSTTFTLTSTAVIFIRTSETVIANVTITNPQLELGSTATTYEPYTPATRITHAFPTTIYGGEVDVERGVLKVTYGIVDLGSLTWTYVSGANARFACTTPISNIKPSDSGSTLPYAICSCYAKATINQVYQHSSDLIFGIQDEASISVPIWVYDSNYTDAATFTTAVTGQKLVYELATPYEIQLSPYEVNLLQGANVITSNGTSVTITYREGTIATLEDIPSETVNKLADMVDVCSENITAIVNMYGSKNLNSYPYYDTTKSGGGIDWTDNGDGTITAEGTSTSDYLTFFCHNVWVNPLRLKNGNYRLTGCPNGGSSSTYYAIVEGDINGVTRTFSDFGYGIDFTVNDARGYADFAVYLGIRTGQNISTPITFEPMIRDVRITNETFAPYAMTNKQLTDGKTDLSAIAPIEDGTTASQAYKVNEYFIRGGKLCKCISAISVGSSFTYNTNYVQTTLAKEIPKYTVSSTDITPGVTPLPAGQFYIVLL